MPIKLSIIRIHPQLFIIRRVLINVAIREAASVTPEEAGGGRRVDNKFMNNKHISFPYSDPAPEHLSGT